MITSKYSQGCIIKWFKETKKFLHVERTGYE